jgi:multidrug efflux pump subunit AcrA (membrane-fusion protein)
MGAQDAGRAPRPDAADDKRWQTVAPGRVEPSSGAIKIAAPVMDVIAQVLVKVNDEVFAGEPLIRLTDNEARARLATAEAQVAFRLRARNDETAAGIPGRRVAARARQTPRHQPQPDQDLGRQVRGHSTATRPPRMCWPTMRR